MKCALHGCIFCVQDQGKIRYDPKTIMWVPDSEEGFVVADIVSNDNGKLTVKLESGAEVSLIRALIGLLISFG